jgi:LysM domain
VGGIGVVSAARLLLVRVRGWAPPVVLDRPRLVRYLAPAACLLAVTATVLGVRTVLRASPSAGGSPTTRAAAHAAPARRHQPSGSSRYYVIASGDTLSGIAARVGNSVDALLRLNPGIEPTALRPGQQVRVK